MMPSLAAYRKSDAVIMVCQNNAKRQIEISALNDVAENILGFKKEELAQKPLSMVISHALDSTIQEYVEYADDAPDLGEVLKKVRSFGVRNRQGNEIPYNFKIVRCDPMDRNPWFQIILLDEEVQKQRTIFRNVLQENFKGHEIIDTNTGLPNRSSLMKDLQLTLFHANSRELNACFAVVELDTYNEVARVYGDDAGLQLHKHVAMLIKQRLRSDDTIGTLDFRTLGVILMETSGESARMVLNRLRWSMGQTPFIAPNNQPLPFTVSMAYCRIEGETTEVEMTEKCEAFLKSQSLKKANTDNLISEVIVVERRKRKDRRKENRKVEMDRRRQDRRNNP
jgi:diguanylate cyclase (GGDEF)-like protein